MIYLCWQTGVTGLAITGVLISILILCVIYKSPTWQANFGLVLQSNKNIEAFLRIHNSVALKRYKLSQVKKMTSNFKEKLGQGGFGMVYRGKLSDGSPIAVKMLSASKKMVKNLLMRLLVLVELLMLTWSLFLDSVWKVEKELSYMNLCPMVPLTNSFIEEMKPFHL